MPVLTVPCPSPLPRTAVARRRVLRRDRARPARRPVPVRPGSASTSRAAPRSSWRPRTANGSRPTRESTDRALEVLRGRVDALGVAEPTLARAGERRIIVELPGVQDPREAAQVIGRTAQLGFHVVARPAAAAATERRPRHHAGAATRTASGSSLGPQVLDGNGVKDASAELPQDGVGRGSVASPSTGRAPRSGGTLVDRACADAGGQPADRDPARRRGDLVPGGAAGRCCSGAGAATQITGQFTQRSADDLAILIKGGALPVPVEVIEQRTVGATLGRRRDRRVGRGRDHRHRADRAVHRAGLPADGADGDGRAGGVRADLLRPAGLAGRDADPARAGRLRARDRARHRRQRAGLRARPGGVRRPARRGPARRPLDTGYRKAWSAILDSNVTTLLAAGLLFFFASGPVKGFGVTLSIGVVASMVSALVVARVLTDWARVRRVVRVAAGCPGSAARAGCASGWPSADRS